MGKVIGKAAQGVLHMDHIPAPKIEDASGSVPDGYTSWNSQRLPSIDRYKWENRTGAVLHLWSLWACAEELP